VAIGEFWREWAREFFSTFIIDHTKDFMQTFIVEMIKYWGVRTGDTAKSVLEILGSLKAELDNLTIDTSGFS
jgi:hypothetical protein